MLPALIKPMLAQKGPEPFDSAEHCFEIKWDGVRCLAFVEAGRVRLQSRQLLDITPQFPELTVLKELPSGTVLDGELVVLEHGKPLLSKILERAQLTSHHRIESLSRQMPAYFVVFDLLYRKGRSLMDWPLRDRRKALKDLSASLPASSMAISEAVEVKGKALFEAVAQAGLEGVMAKRWDSPYRAGKRASAWLKIKVASLLPRRRSFRLFRTHDVED